MAVAFRAAGSLVSGLSTATPAVPATGLAVGDIAIAVCESANQNVWLVDPNDSTRFASSPGGPGFGWEPIPGFSGAGVGTAGDASATKLWAWWRRIGSTTTVPNIRFGGDNGVDGDHVSGYVTTWSGCEDAQDPFDPGAAALASNTDNSDTTSVAFPAITTTVANAMVVNVCASPNDTTSAQFSGWANAGLTGYAERADAFGTSGNGGGIGVASGSLASAGSSGSSTASVATNPAAGGADYQARLTLALIEPQSRSYAGFPTVESHTGGANNSNTSSHLVTLPATVEAGDILLVVFANDGTATITSWSDTTGGTWNSLYSTADANSAVRVTARWKVAGGSEDGATLTVGTSATEQASWRVLRISGASSVEAATPASSSGSGWGHADTPALSPSWGAANTLWIAAVGCDSETMRVANHPNNYVGDQSFGGGTAGTMCAASYYRNAAASEAPAGYIFAASGESVVSLIAVQAANVGPLDISPSFANASAIGSARLDLTIAPAGLAAAEAFGAPATSYAIRPAGAEGASAIGAATFAQTVQPAGLAGAQAFGTSSFRLTVAPAGHAGVAALGAPAARVSVAPAGLASGAAMGEPTLFRVGLTITPAGLGNAGQLGTARLDLALSPAGHANAVQLGALAVRLSVNPVGAASASATGAPTFAVPSVAALAGLANLPAFGTLTLRRLWELVPSAPQSWNGAGAAPAPWSLLAPDATAWNAEAGAAETWTPVPPTPETWS